MLSIQSRSGQSGAYYLGTTAEGYYLSGSYSTMWLGRGAESLGFSGPVRSAEFLKVLGGLGPRGAKLVQNVGAKNRQAAWDLTFSLPKGPAVVWALGDAKQRAAIERAHLEGVKAAIGYLERTSAFTRTGRGGYERERIGFVIAAFHHATSRLGDPSPHTHCVLMNVGVREDGKTGSVVSKDLYLAKMTAGAVYQAKVAAELERLGLRTEATRTAKGRFLGTFELPDVPKAVCAAFSKRRTAIEEALGASGTASAAASEKANLRTRPKKTNSPPREELFEGWRREAAPLGFTAQQARSLFDSNRKPCDDLAATQEAILAAKKNLTQSVSYFTERELFRATLVRTLGKGVEPSLVETAVKTHLDTSGDTVHLGGFRSSLYFTTRETWNREKELLASAKALADRTSRGLRAKTVGEHVDKSYRPDPERPAFELKSEQKVAVEKLTEKGGDIRILSGYAGTGKTAVLRAVREAYEREGYKVIGASVAGAAAEQLEKGSGIKSDTVAMRFIQMNGATGFGHSVWHHAKQILKTAANELHRGLDLPIYRLRGPLVIDKKTVLVVDEAGMLGSKDLAKLLKAVEAGGGKLILVGDHRQLPPIPAGGGFRGLAERFGFVELEDITRQKTEWGRFKTRDLAEGLTEKVLREAAAKKQLTVARDRDGAMVRLVADWSRLGVAAPHDHAMLASTNADVLVLNVLAQKERERAGLVHGPAVNVGGYAVREGDRVIFRENSRSLGVKNGTFGTVVWAGVNTLGIQPDGKNPDGTRKLPVAVNVRKYDKLELGYAITVYRGQGATFDTSYVLLGGAGTSRQTSYVAGSRERDSVHFYTDRFEAGHALEQLARGETAEKGVPDSPLARAMAKSVEKKLAHDAPEPVRQPQYPPRYQQTQRP